MADERYKKLGGRATRPKDPFVTNTLWLGSDHLLQIEHTGYSEDYKRFYFSDIQGFTVKLTKRRRNIAIGLGFFLVLFGGALAYFPDPIARWVFGVILGVFALLFVMNLWKGQTCTCLVKTAVQEEILPSLRRLRKTRKALGQVRELIGQTQGILAPEEARNKLAAPGAWGASETASAPAASENEGIPPQIT